jgi:uncharacterized cupredoxin-like copper-binding protein
MFKRFLTAAAIAFSAGFAGVTLAAESGHGPHHDHGHAAHDHQGDAPHASSAGRPGKAAEVTRTITVSMHDTMRYEPSSISARRGETIRFLVQNKGQLAHEFGLGTLKEQRAHAEMMRQMPDMKHDDPNVVVVEPGKTRELIWTFSKAGRFQIACHVPGHYEAGMKAAVNVRQ